MSSRCRLCGAISPVVFPHRDLSTLFFSPAFPGTGFSMRAPETDASRPLSTISEMETSVGATYCTRICATPPCYSSNHSSACSWRVYGWDAATRSDTTSKCVGETEDANEDHDRAHSDISVNSGELGIAVPQSGATFRDRCWGCLHPFQSFNELFSNALNTQLSNLTLAPLNVTPRSSPTPQRPTTPPRYPTMPRPA